MDFISLDQTVEYSDLNKLHNIFLGDAVRVTVPKLGLSVAMRMTQYSYDCLLKKYTSCTLGTALESVEGSLISSSQLASGSIGAIKLAMNSVGSGQLQSDSVSSLHIQEAAVDTMHIA